MRATLLVRSRKETIATVTTNIRQYYTTNPQTDGILVLVQDEGDTTREIQKGDNSNGYNKQGNTTPQIHKQMLYQYQ